MSIVTARHPFAIQLAKALGLDTSRLRGYSVVVQIDQPVVVTATYLAADKTANEGAEILVQKYQLSEIAE